MYLNYMQTTPHSDYTKIMIKDKIIQIKRSRLSPIEISLFDIFNSLKIKEQTRYPNFICWEKDGLILFIIDTNKSYFIGNNRIVYLSDSKNEYHYTQIRRIIKIMVIEYMGWDKNYEHIYWRDNKFFDGLNL